MAWLLSLFDCNNHALFQPFGPPCNPVFTRLSHQEQDVLHKRVILDFCHGMIGCQIIFHFIGCCVTFSSTLYRLKPENITYPVEPSTAFQVQFNSYLDLEFRMQSIGSLQRKYSIGAFELLSKTAPIQALSLIFIGPFIDYYLNSKSTVKYKFQLQCNYSQYLCIGSFLAVSFQVSGHMKTVCMLTLGWLLFDLQLTFKNITGMTLAVIGMVIYSWAVEVEKQANVKIAPAKTSLTEEELRLLKEGVENDPRKDVDLGEAKA